MKNIILLFFILAFSSCATFKENSLNENRVFLSENNLKKFEGTFKIVSKDTSERTLDKSLVNHYSFKKRDNTENSLDSYKLKVDRKLNEESENRWKINLKMIDKNHVKMELYEDTAIIESRVLKFKIIEDYLFIKKATKFNTLLLLLNGNHTLNTRVGLLENENITLDSVSTYLAFLVIMPLGDHKREYYGLEFERID